MTPKPLLELKQVTKRFSGVAANDSVNLSFYPGEIHSILGENGAGKSTLMNLISGLMRPDSGEICFKNRKVSFKSPREAMKQGIGMVHQHFMLINAFTVTENVILGAEPRRAGLIQMKNAREKVREIAKGYDFTVNPDERVETLSVGQKQQVEIMKTLYRKVSLLILDEPTAVLTPLETEKLFSMMRSLSSQGISVIFITHKLKEVMAVSDRITVMRQGAVVATSLPGETDEDQLISRVIGKRPEEAASVRVSSSDRPLFEIRGIDVSTEEGTPVIRNLSLKVREGEIYGIAGVQGNGQTELAEVICGICPVQSGEMVLDGEPLPFLNPKKITRKGLAHIPEDRLKQGLVLSFPVAFNQVLKSYDKAPFSQKGLLNKKAIFSHSESLIREYDIRGAEPFTPVSRLSGGNQQKVILSRELGGKIKLLVLSQPTRGLDVGAVQSVYNRIFKLREQGVGMILISSDLDEIFLLSDRIAVMYRGEITGEFLKERANREVVGNLMSGRI